MSTVSIWLLIKCSVFAVSALPGYQTGSHACRITGFLLLMKQTGILAVRHRHIMHRFQKSSIIFVRSVFISMKVLTERSEEHTSELQSRFDLVCRLLLEKKKKI